MFATTGYFSARPGMETDLKEYIEELGKSPEVVSISLFKIRDEENGFVEYVLWKDENAHDTCISTPEFPVVYQRLVDLLSKDPEWHSAGMVYTSAKNWSLGSLWLTTA